MISMKRPGRADMAPTRSDSMAASSSACVISSTVAPVRAPKPQYLVAHKQARLRIERTERFVEQNEARLQHQRARDADALAHAAGQLRRIGLGKILQAHEGERIVDAAADFRLRRRRCGAARRRRYPTPSARESSRPPGTRRRCRRRLRRGSACPRTSPCPSLAVCKPARTSRKVDLPQPDGPTTAKNSPLRRSRSIGPSACTGGWPPAPAIDPRDLVDPRMNLAGHR